MARPSSTVTPMDRPVIPPMTICMVWLPVDTAEMSAVVPNRPTAHRSTAPYRAWRISASSTGPQKVSRPESTGPSVSVRPLISPAPQS